MCFKCRKNKEELQDYNKGLNSNNTQVLLKLNERMEAVNQYGTFLDNYVIEKEKCNCYAIDKFFGEVVYNSEHNTITNLRSFKYGGSLYKYAPKINQISSIIS